MKNAGPLMYGQIISPFCPPDGAVKQLGLKNCPDDRFLRGSQVSRGEVLVNAFVPR